MAEQGNELDPGPGDPAEPGTPGPLLRDPPPPPGYVDPIGQSDLLDHLSATHGDSL